MPYMQRSFSDIRVTQPKSLSNMNQPREIRPETEWNNRENSRQWTCTWQRTSASLYLSFTATVPYLKMQLVFTKFQLRNWAKRLYSLMSRPSRSFGERFLLHLSIQHSRRWQGNGEVPWELLSVIMTLISLQAPYKPAVQSWPVHWKILQQCRHYKKARNA